MLSPHFIATVLTITSATVSTVNAAISIGAVGGVVTAVGAAVVDNTRDLVQLKCCQLISKLL
jgi:hypothetical protein